MKTDQKEKAVEAPPVAASVVVPYSKLYTYASGSDKCLLIVGWIAAAITGLGMPSFVFLIGSVIDSFNVADATPLQMVNTVSQMSLIFTCVGIGVWIFSFLNYACLMMASEKIGQKTRMKYLEAILK